MDYYTNCTGILKELSTDIGIKTIQNSSSGAGAISHASQGKNETTANNPSMFSAIFGDSNAIESEVKPTALVNPKKAKVLFDYDAVEPNEIGVWANQVNYFKSIIMLVRLEFVANLVIFSKVINVQLLPNDNDWVLAEAGTDQGKIPKAYIQILDS